MVYVKRLEIRGFRSYREKTSIEFDPSYNVIVGLNGSGKSNILLALQFVAEVSDFTLRDATKILHEGMGKASNNAQVDLVVVDDTAKSTTNVTFTRRMSIRKDELLIDFKIVKKSEFTSRLRMFGFSSLASPYSIIKQGRVMEMACQSDYQRLKLIEGVAGISEYELKRKEALKDLTEIETKSKNVDRMLCDVTTKLDMMKAEQAQLEQYNQLKVRLSYIDDLIYKKESEVWNDKLTSTEAEIKSKIKKVTELGSALEEVIQTTNSTEETLEAVTANIRTIETDTDDQQQLLEIKQRELLSAKEKLSRLISAVDKRDAGVSEEETQALRNDLTKTRDQQRELTEKLFELRRKRDNGAVELHNIGLERHEVKSRLSGDTQNFDELTVALQTVEKQISSTNEKITGLERDKQNNEKLLDDYKAKLSEFDNALQKLQGECRTWEEAARSKKQAKQTLEAEIHDLNQRIYDTDRRLHELNSSCGYRGNRSSIPVGNSVAFNNINRDAIQNGYADNVMGPLVDHVKVKTISGITPHIAVEVAGEGQWYNLLVKDAHTARRCATAVRAGGYCTITPLEDIRHRTFSPKLPPPSTILLTEFLEYEPAVESAIKQVFGTWLLVDNLEAAVGYCDWNCVTVDGTVLDKSGIMGGGSYSRSNNILIKREKEREMDEAMKSHSKELEDLREAKRQLEPKLVAVDQDIWDSYNEITKIKSQCEQVEKEARDCRRLEKNTSDRNSTICETLNRYNLELKKLNGKVTIWRKEFLTTSSSQGVKDFQCRLEELNLAYRLIEESTAKLDKQIDKLEAKLDEVNLVLDKLEDSLEQAIKNSKKYTDNLQEMGNEAEIESLEDYIRMYSEQYNSMKEQWERRSNDRKSLITYKNKLIQTCKQSKKKSDSLNNQLKEVQADIQSLNLKAQTYRSQMSKLPNAGKLPKSAANDNSDLQGLDINGLRDALYKGRTELAEFGDLNTTLFDKVKSYTKEHQAMLERRQNLNKANESIHDLINHLDSQKKNVLIHTFHTINKHFLDLITKLAPGCKGKLSLMKSNKGEDNGDDEERSDNVGVSLRVSFQSYGKNSFKMAQLSGGQRTMVAVCLIFAIQRTETAPMYILDEIDAALDERYRELVAEIIEESCEKSQFIMTTFRRQLAVRGRKFIGVNIAQKVSSIKYLTMQNALEILSESEAKENETSPLAIKNH